MPFDIDKRKEWMKEYYKKNKEKLIEYSKHYQKTHRQQTSCRTTYKPRVLKVYKDDGIKNTIIEKKTVVVCFD